MRTQNRPFRLTATVAVSALLLAQTMTQSVVAQPAPPPLQAGPSDQQTADPPSRVGRLARFNGTVSFHTQDETQWNPAALNYPVSAGNAFWTEPNAQAEIQVSASRVVMAPSSELDIASLTDTDFQATEPQGEVYLRLRPAAPDETYSMQTPRGLVSLASTGRYAIVAGDTQSPTLVIVVEGSAHIAGPGVELDVGPNQMATITGSDAFQGDVGPAQRDPFLTAMLDSERPPPAPAVAPPPAVAAMPGGEDLAQYGTWSDSPEYGQVWYPQVAQDWVPYREGNWAYVAPWGWTWVDAAPWGFAPFHYGRWAEVHGRWGWIPGRYEGRPRPVYAPALVTFLGVGVVAGVGIGAALAAGRVGWVPLGPREPYHPWYRSSDRYFRQVNVTHVTNITTINRNVTINNFANQRAATMVPTTTMTGSRPVGRSFQRMDPAQFAQARPVIGQQPLRPAPTTVGVTPAVARQLNLPQTTPAHPAAPGPSFHAMPAAGTAGVHTVPMAHPGTPPPLHNPGQAPVPATAGAAHPFTGTPPLATPGNRPVVTGPGGPPAQGAVPHTGTPVVAAPGGTPGPAITSHGPAPTPASPATPALRTPGGGPGQFGQPQGHVQSTGVAPGAVPHPLPGTAGGPPSTPAPFRGTPTIATPTAPQVHTPSPGAIQPATPFHANPPVGTPAPQVRTPSPGAIQQAAPFHAAPPPAAVHTPPPPAVTHVAPAAPPPQVHAAPPPQVFHPAPSPPPVAHTAPPPQVHAAPPPPAVHPPPPAPAPAAHAAPQGGGGGGHKRPGES